MNYFWLSLIASAASLCGVFLFCAMFLSGSRCREEEYEDEINELLKVIADNDAELAKVSQERDELRDGMREIAAERDELRRKLEQLQKSVAAIEMARVNLTRQNGIRQVA